MCVCLRFFLIWYYLYFLYHFSLKQTTLYIWSFYSLLYWVIQRKFIVMKFFTTQIQNTSTTITNNNTTYNTTNT
eukprot:UN10922